MSDAGAAPKTPSTWRKPKHVMPIVAAAIGAAGLIIAAIITTGGGSDERVIVLPTAPPAADELLPTGAETTTTAPTTTRAPESTASAAAAPSPTSSDAAALWSGQVVLDDAHVAVFDDLDPGTRDRLVDGAAPVPGDTPCGAGWDLRLGGNGSAPFLYACEHLFTGAVASVSAASCSAAIVSNNSVGLNDLARMAGQGAGFCLVTGSGHVVGLSVVSIEPALADYTGATVTVRLQAAVYG